MWLDPVKCHARTMATAGNLQLVFVVVMVTLLAVLPAYVATDRPVLSPT